MTIVDTEYAWNDGLPTCAHEYLLPAVQDIVQTLYKSECVKILDIECGNGHVASTMAKSGYSVIGVDASRSGIEIARSAHPNVQFKVCSVYDDELIDAVGDQVECVISLEVVEHLFYPRKLFEQNYRLLKSNGYLIISTPFHGYLKNLALSLVNGWDSHFSVGWDGGHIKFFSKSTLAQMARDAGFKSPRFRGAGRFPGLWKSLIMVVQK